MIAVALTGGIGSGKSTVASMLVERGAVLVDADQLARDVVEPGTDGLARVVERFGPELLLTGGRLDRSRLASIVFADEAARADLNSIIHPAVGVLIAERLAGLRPGDDVVVIEIPLFAESDAGDRYPIAGVLVVDTPADIALERLVTGRGMDPVDAERRMAAQTSRQARLALADYVICNKGSLDELAFMVDRAWTWMRGLAATSGRKSGPAPLRG